MSAAEALQAAQNAGVEIGIDGDDLVIAVSAASGCGRRSASAQGRGVGRARCHRAREQTTRPDAVVRERRATSRR